ncbi:putative nuclease HARBI1 [Folsomia candida]|uniref:putative nuclease HARBI1 n=1 Tax=Folsomia candida TaxID=158441 RepID=UPI000B8F148C|nr:putative nuclease HARBI1 [Folsomia candida]
MQQINWYTAMALSRLQDFEDRRNRINRFSIRKLQDMSNPFESFSEYQFQARFRLSKEGVIFVAALIKPKIVSPLKRGAQIPAFMQLLVALRFYSAGTFQIQIGDLTNLSQGTISKIVKRVSHALASLKPQFIRYPTENEAVVIRQRFYDYGGFPGVIGAIDCTHVLIKSVGGPNAELFRDRKGNFSINVQLICTSDLKITNVVARWYGSCHDNRIFENSKICGQLERAEVPSVLLGDSGYGCTPFLLTPFSHPVTAAEKRYQSAQIKTRNPIERCNGVLKQRFNCLRYMRLKLRTCLTTIVACCVLHNIALLHRDNLQFEEEVDEDHEEDTVTPLSSSGIASRTRIVLSHFS